MVDPLPLVRGVRTEVFVLHPKVVFGAILRFDAGAEKSQGTRVGAQRPSPGG